MLIQISDGHTLGPFDTALVRGELAGYNIQKSGFAFAVCADEADVLSLEQAE